jgi:hypothetical protein
VFALQNDLTFLRVRSKKHEIMIAPGKIRVDTMLDTLADDRIKLYRQGLQPHRDPESQCRSIIDAANLEGAD